MLEQARLFGGRRESAWILGRGSLAECLDRSLGVGVTEGLSYLWHLKEGGVRLGTRQGLGDEGHGIWSALMVDLEAWVDL